MSAVTEERVDVADGKYGVILRSDGSSSLLRYGEKWDHMPASNVEAALARDLINFRAAAEDLLIHIGMGWEIEEKAAALKALLPQA